MKTLDIEIALAQYFNPRTNLMIPNVHWGFSIHECDMLVMSAAGYLSEVEIKVSLSDLKKDKKKEHGHEDDRIKCFYFAMPKKLLKHSDLVPERAGILSVDYSPTPGHYKIFLERGAVINKKAPKMRIGEMYELARLGALRIWTLKRKIKKLQEE